MFISRSDKLSALQALDERSVRERVIVPLLGRMGLHAAQVYHGPREYGKDVICFDYNRLGGRTYLGVVVKIEGLSGSVSAPTCLREVLYQAERCFDVPYHNLYDMNEITMDQVWIVTTGKIVPGAADSIAEYLRKSNLAKLVRFVSGEQLVDLLNQHYPAFWNREIESIEAIREQRDRVVAFLKKLLISLQANPDEVRAIAENLLDSQYPPAIRYNESITLSGLSPYSIELVDMPDIYRHAIYSDECGIIHDQFRAARKELASAMREIEEVSFKYDEVVKQNDPARFVEAFKDELADEYPFWKATTGTVRDAIKAIQSLEQGLRDVEALLEILRSKGKLEWALQLFDSVMQHEAEVERFIPTVQTDQFSLHWPVTLVGGKETVTLSFAPQEAVQETVFVTTHKRMVSAGLNWNRERSERLVKAREVLDAVLWEVRKYINQKIGFRNET